MNDIRELYQQMIIDHGRKPRNFGPLPHASHTQHGHNPLCGDQITLYLLIDNAVIQDVKFEGRGCAISTASASMMSQAITGMTVAEAEALFDKFHAVLTDKQASSEDIDSIGKLGVLSGVSAYPARVKCATLAWHTLHAALRNEHKTVSTE